MHDPAFDFRGNNVGGTATRIRATVRVLAAMLALLGAAVTAAQDLEIIDLHHRRADEVTPIVQPLLAPGGVLSGMDDKLLVRTTPSNLEQIRQAVAAIDRPRRQLLITVGQGTVSNLDAAGVRGSATIGGGDVHVGVNRPPAPEPGAQVVAHSGRQQASLQNVSSVRALEGTETYIAVGQSVPVQSTQVTPGWGGTVQRSTNYRDVGSGFYATARISGDLVTLEISARQQQYQPAAGGAIAMQGSNSVVSGRLGEWIELGAVRESNGSSSGGLLVWGRRSSRSEYSAWIKVEEAR
jgi:type II secretory pathway component GspD/PulD (secretin)